MANQEFPLIFERSKEGRTSFNLPALDVPEIDLNQELGDTFVRKTPAELPQVSELEVMRHYTGLSNRNYGVDSGFYPLGSCTMKYNPKINEDVARLEGFSHVHPYQEPEQVQGAMEMLYDLQSSLREITGMYDVTLQSAAGAQGEWTALLMIRAFHLANGDTQRNKLLCQIPELVRTQPPPHLQAFDEFILKQTKTV